MYNLKHLNNQRDITKGHFSLGISWDCIKIWASHKKKPNGDTELKTSSEVKPHEKW
jgi:hypothetical protein